MTLFTSATATMNTLSKSQNWMSKAHDNQAAKLSVHSICELIPACRVGVMTVATDLQVRKWAVFVFLHSARPQAVLFPRHVYSGDTYSWEPVCVFLLFHIQGTEMLSEALLCINLKQHHTLSAFITGLNGCAYWLWKWWLLHSLQLISQLFLPLPS